MSKIPKISIFKARKLFRSFRGSFDNILNRFYAHLPNNEENNKHAEIDEAKFNKQYIDLFQDSDIDGWQIRQAMNNLAGMDLVPDPTVIDAALRACRRVNDFALAIRWIECCKDKCGSEEKTLYPYIMENIRPTLIELGIPTLEQLGYDEPQLALVSVYDM